MHGSKDALICTAHWDVWIIEVLCQLQYAVKQGCIRICKMHFNALRRLCSQSWQVEPLTWKLVYECCYTKPAHKTHHILDIMVLQWKAKTDFVSCLDPPSILMSSSVSAADMQLRCLIYAHWSCCGSRYMSWVELFSSCTGLLSTLCLQVRAFCEAFWGLCTICSLPHHVSRAALPCIFRSAKWAWWKPSFKQRNILCTDQLIKRCKAFGE